jgi:glycosyltransferase involved in cell wall biosynthesis
MFKVSFLLPTARPRFRYIMRSWDMENCEILISYEIQNPYLERLTNEEKSTFKANIKEFEHDGPNNGVCWAWNNLAKHATGDAIQIIADDLVNITEGDWRPFVLQHIPDFLTEPWVAIANDNLYTFQNKLAAHPLMSRHYYDLFGYVWYPEYKAYGCDNELYYIATSLNRIKFIPEYVHQNRHTGSWAGAEFDKWSDSIQATGSQAMEVWTQKDRIEKIIAEKRSLIDERFRSKG